MNGSNQRNEPVARAEERRSSVAVIASTSGLTRNNNDNNNETNPREQQPKGPLAAVMSEDHSANITQPTTAPTSMQKQSFLSKFARSEVKSSKSIDKSAHLNKTSDCYGSSKTINKISTEQNSNSNSNSNNYNSATRSKNKPSVETEGDRGGGSKSVKSKGGLGSDLFPTRATKSFCESETSEHTSTTIEADSSKQQTILQSSRDMDINNNNYNIKNNNNDDDDDNQVLPAWPSRIDASTFEPSMVQVYSLKDYSQVSGPTENVASSTATGRLMKSMSQDRKVDSRSKRMSECILSSMGHAGPFYPGTLGDAKSSNQARQQRLPSMMGKISTTNLSSMGPATSVNSLLPQGKNSTLINESRIDRMRKLFVSPLLLRGSTGSKSSSQPSHQVSNHSRLSLQAGANMLNKPHHLMHAMYRTRAGAHHSRRSPLRQKSGAIKGFRVYGCPLSMANTMYPITCFGRADIYKRQSVPYILARLCNYIEENSSQLTHEGIFRVSGNARLMEKLKTLFDHLGDAPLESECVDVATSASMLKMYLRELPDPLIPTRMNYYFFTLAKKYSSLLAKSSFNGFRASDNATSTTSTLVNEASSISDGQSTLDRQKLALMRDLTKLIRKLPIENYNLLKYLACFLHRISLKQQSNKMSAEALGIVFGPNVFRIRSESYKGLKEQELSNQIMASIISNYKHIFDCELTDPLGNLVKSDEFLNSNREREEPKERPHQTSQVNAAGRDEPTTSSGVSRRDGAKSSPTTPSTSSTAYGSSNHHLHHYHPARCPKHGHRINYHYNEDPNESEDEDANPGRDDDDNDEDSDGEGEDCEDDDGSYTRTSGSGSYCSSLASDTVESVYEGDVEGGQYDDEEDNEFGGLGSDSSSECGSETSYTPSSSHTDSNTNEAELSSSNFGSVRSLNGLNGVDENDANSGDARKPCLVCKRRESQQIEANKVREQMPAPSTSGLCGKKSDILSDTTKDRHIAGHSANDENAAAEPQGSEQNQLADVKNQLYTSTRRKHNGEEAIKMPTVMKAIKDDFSTKASAMTRSDFTLDSKNSPRQAATPNDGRPNRHGMRDHQAKQTQKHSLIRRRSSSASSLFRVSKRLDQASQKRSSGKEDHHHVHRTRIHSDRRKYHNDSRGYNRRSRNKSSASGRKNALDPSKPGPSQQSGSGNKAVGGSSKTCPSWKKGDYYVPELLALNLSPEARDQLVWNYVSSSFLDVPECDRFCALRSYNSDETLLRTQECSTANSTEVASRARRRYSGQDYLNANQESLLVNACSQFTQIFETYEDDNFFDVDVSTKISKKTRSQQPCELGLSSTSAIVKSSAISLLGDQMISFKHSSLSLSEDTSDPIVGQLKVIKDLVRALERLIKNGIARGINQEVSDFAFQLISDAGANDRMDNIASCCIDHLIGLSITVTLENIKRDSSSDKPKIDPVTQEGLIALMGVKIADLKRRYNNLKYIREHYHKHHAKQHKEQLAADMTARPIEADQELMNSHRSISQLHDRHSICSDASSLGSTNAPTANDCDNQPSTSQQKLQSRTTISAITEAVTQAPISCKFGSLCPVEFVFNIEKQLASRRISGCRFVSLNEMTLAQLQSEKLELQKNLLRYEHWFGRPTTRSEVNLVGHLYDRYRMVKIIKQRRQSTE